MTHHLQVWDRTGLPPVVVPAGSLRTLYITDDKTATDYTNLAASLLVEKNAGPQSPHASGRKSPLATKNLLEDTDGLRRPRLLRGGDAIHQCPLDAVALYFC